MAARRKPARRHTAKFDTGAWSPRGTRVWFALAGLAVAMAGPFLIAAKSPVAGTVAVAVGALVAALSLFSGDPDRIASPPAARWLSGRGELWALAAVTVAAAVMRTASPVWLLTGCQVDEGFNGRDAIEFLNIPRFQIYAGTNDGQPTMFTYQIALFFKVFGIGLGSEHAVSVVTGVLTCVAFYFLVRTISGVPLALLGALLLAFMRWHVNFSRIAYEAIQAPLFQVLAFYFLIRGWRMEAREGSFLQQLLSRKTACFALAGAGLAFGMNSYTAFRFVPFLAAFFLLWHALIEPKAVRRNLVPVLAMGVVFFVVAGPIIQYAFAHWADFKNRTRMAWFANPVNMPQDKSELDVLWATLTKQLWMFHGRGDPSGINNLPGEPMLDPFLGAVFAAGFFWTMLRILSGENLLLHLWFWAMMLIGVISIPHEAPTARRTLLLVPVIVLMGVAYLSRLRRELSGAYGLAGRRLGLVLAALFVAASGAWNAWTYHGRQLAHERVYNEFRHAESQTAELLNRLQAKGKVRFLLSPELGHPEDYGVAAVIDVATGHLKNVDYFQPWGNLAPTDDSSLAWVYRPEGRGAIESLLNEVYPQGERTEYGTPFRKVSLHAFSVTREQQAAAQGLRAKLVPSSGSPIDRTVPHVGADVAGSAGLALPVACSWEGSLFVPKRGMHTLGLRTSQAASVEFEGKRVLSIPARPAAESATVDIQLVPGYHTIRVASTQTRRGEGIELQLGLKGTTLAPVPRTQLLAKTLARRGWTARYHQNNVWAGDPVFVRRDPFIMFWWGLFQDPLDNPLSITWDGWLTIDKPGEYRFRGEADDGCFLELDGKRVGESLRHNFTNQFEHAQPMAKRTYRARFGFFQDAGDKAAKLLWQPPGAPEWEVVPPSAVRPAN